MHSQPWRRHRALRHVAAMACLATASALVVAACSSSGTSSNANSTGGTKIAGGTATWALQPSSVPNYIFSFTSGTYSSTVNIEEFQYLMYRPLYWFGNGRARR
jgi:peptide/nickel transport system substrate-binding protein